MITHVSKTINTWILINKTLMANENLEITKGSDNFLKASFLNKTSVNLY